MTEKPPYTYDRNAGASKHLYADEGTWHRELRHLGASDLSLRQWETDLIDAVWRAYHEKAYITTAQAAAIHTIYETYTDQYERKRTMTEATVTVVCEACGSKITTPFCPICGKDHRGMFPEADLVDFHRRAVLNTEASLEAAATTRDMPKKKLERIEARFNKARERFAALASLLKEVERPCAIPDCCKEP